ncbi:hypothetical protein [Clostridium sp.]|uniref:hypothetical protein n=1 Tax=Clostridium sp. TaxID=1506 RepID=UPI00399684BA
MKIGVRKPSLKRKFKAMTTGRAKRAMKKAVIPGYGKKGAGWIKNPKRAAYNKIYNKTTVGVWGNSSKKNDSTVISVIKLFWYAFILPFWIMYWGFKLIFLLLKWLYQIIMKESVVDSKSEEIYYDKE